MPRTAQSLIGLRFGRFIVIADAPRGFQTSNKRKKPVPVAYSVCRCDCGKERIVRSCELRYGHSKSCGCLRRELDTKHGLSHSPTWVVWTQMKTRCMTSTNPAYKHYGGRGIKVCERWMDFRYFLEDMGIRPNGLTLDRINNNGPYTKDNCRWATMETQAGNRRSSRAFVIRGVAGCLTALARHFGINGCTVEMRLKHGWDEERAFTEPTHNWTRRK